MAHNYKTIGATQMHGAVSKNESRRSLYKFTYISITSNDLTGDSDLHLRSVAWRAVLRASFHFELGATV
jgi:hypothetical protein